MSMVALLNAVRVTRTVKRCICQGESGPEAGELVGQITARVTGVEFRIPVEARLAWPGRTPLTKFQ